VKSVELWRRVLLWFDRWREHRNKTSDFKHRCVPDNRNWWCMQ